VTIELASNTTGATTASFEHFARPRHLFPHSIPPASPYLIPLHDSRAVPELAPVVAFYRDALLMHPFHHDDSMIAFAFNTTSLLGYVF